jgi:hypothetical protein
MDQRNFKYTKNTRRSENGVLGTFGEEIFKSGGRIRVIDPWGVESTQESKDSTEESRNPHQGGLESSPPCVLESGEEMRVKG